MISRRQVTEPGTQGARQRAERDEDNGEAQHEQHGPGEHPPATRVLEVGAREPCRIGEVARQQRDHARARRTRPARPPAPPGRRAASTRTAPVSWNHSPIGCPGSATTSSTTSSSVRLDGSGRMMLAATRPRRRGRRTWGCVEAVNVPEKASRVSPPGEKTMGTSGRGLRSNAVACSGLASRMLMPTNCAVCRRTGVSRDDLVRLGPARARTTTPRRSPPPACRGSRPGRSGSPVEVVAGQLDRRPRASAGTDCTTPSPVDVALVAGSLQARAAHERTQQAGKEKYGDAECLGPAAPRVLRRRRTAHPCRGWGSGRRRARSRTPGSGCRRGSGARSASRACTAACAGRAGTAASRRGAG